MAFVGPRFFVLFSSHDGATMVDFGVGVDVGVVLVSVSSWCF